METTSVDVSSVPTATSTTTTTDNADLVTLNQTLVDTNSKLDKQYELSLQQTSYTYILMFAIIGYVVFKILFKSIIKSVLGGVK
jgi:hypothetical protein